MELAADHRVTVLERRPICGGKARTWTDPELCVFREHSFRVFHATYHNTFDTMQRVPLGDGRTIRDNLVQYVTRQDVEATGDGVFKRWLASHLGDREITRVERARLAVDAVRLLRALCASDARLRDRYADKSFEQLFLRRPDGSRGALFGGLRDMSQVEYSADRVHPDVKVMLAFLDKHFMHGIPGVAWNALVGPTSDTFIEPWKRHLIERGVEFRVDSRVEALEYDGRVRAALLDDGTRVTADSYVACVPTTDLLKMCPGSLLRDAPAIARLSEVRRVWNNGAIIYNSKPIRFQGGYYMWHPWRVAVTTYAHRWRKEFDMSAYGVGDVRGRIRDIISYVITDWFAPGVRVDKRACDCTPDEIYEELCAMCLEDPAIMPEFAVEDHVYPAEGVRCIVDGSLIYGADGRIVENEDTLAHLPPGASFRMPPAQSGIDNLALAGCHCFNAFGCGDSMEGANETGRRAANAVLEREGASRRVAVLEGRLDSAAGRVFRAARQLDDFVYRLGRR